MNFFIENPEGGIKPPPPDSQRLRILMNENLLSIRFAFCYNLYKVVSGFNI